MKTPLVDANRNIRKPRIPAFVCLLTLFLTACSSSVPSSQPPETTPEPAVQPQAGGHPPVILRVVEREEVIDGYFMVLPGYLFYGSGWRCRRDDL